MGTPTQRGSSLVAKHWDVLQFLQRLCPYYPDRILMGPGIVNRLSPVFMWAHVDVVQQIGSAATEPVLVSALLEQADEANDEWLYAIAHHSPDQQWLEEYALRPPPPPQRPTLLDAVATDGLPLGGGGLLGGATKHSCPWRRQGNRCPTDWRYATSWRGRWGSPNPLLLLLLLLLLRPP